MKKDISIAVFYIGCIIGAGFASGQETMQFFSSYGKISYLSIIIMSIAFGILAYTTLTICQNHRVHSYKELEELTGKGKSTKIFVISTNIYMFVCMSAMFAGAGALLNEAFGIHKIIGSIALATLCYFIIIRDTSKIMNINMLMTIVLIVGSIAIGIYIIAGLEEKQTAVQAFNAIILTVKKTYSNFTKIRYNWIMALVLYISYNFIAAKLVLVNNSRELEKTRSRLVVAILTTITFITIGTLQNKIILDRLTELIDKQIPMLAVIMLGSRPMQYAYIIIILLAMITTSMATGWGLVTQSSGDYRLRAIVIIISAVAAAQIGFADIVAYVYPIFGYIGVLEIVTILVKGMKGRNKNAKKNT